jgi:predicted GNAT superfamily acetyltransferase
MQSVVIRAAVPGDFDSVCALNLIEEKHTSAMDVARLTELDEIACYHRVASLDGVVSAFLLAMCHGCRYQNNNFEWFSKRYARFIYIDRIVVAPAARGQRLGSILYEDLFRYARSKAIPFVACEYNIVPPNEPSRLFHEKFGFREQGTQWIAKDSKRVSLQVADLTLDHRG